MITGCALGKKNKKISLICFYVLKVFYKKFQFYYFYLCFKLIFFVFSNHFNIQMLKIIFKK